MHSHIETHTQTHSQKHTFSQKEKKNETLPVATICMDIESIMLSEINQRKTNTA